ncbi:MAG: 23S rRNA (pseudouridine(1915)-N(3))-methyltransferase RlmH [Acidobacteriota bacterium]
MKLSFLWVGETKDPLLSRVEQRYFKRVKQHFPAEKAAVPDLKKSDLHQQNAQLAREARQIEKKLSERAYRVILDSEGKEFTSPALALFLEKLMNRGVSEVAFVMGGHLGVHESVRESAHQKMSLTKLTLPHELARVLLLEQIYRAVTIIKHLPYHK